MRDTHVLVWFDQNDENLGPAARLAIETAGRKDGIAVSAISFREVAMLVRKDRLNMRVDLSAWRNGLLAGGLIEIPVDGAVGVTAAALAARGRGCALEEEQGEARLRVVAPLAVVLLAPEDVLRALPVPLAPVEGVQREQRADALQPAGQHLRITAERHPEVGRRLEEVSRDYRGIELLEQARDERSRVVDAAQPREADGAAVGNHPVELLAAVDKRRQLA